MKSTFQDRLAVFVVPVACCALAIAWTVIRGGPIADEDIGLVANAPGAERAALATAPTAPMPVAIAAAPTRRDAALDEPSTEAQPGDTQALDSTLGDYSQPDPLPAEMMRHSYGAASLGIVEQEQPASVVRVSEVVSRIAGEGE